MPEETPVNNPVFKELYCTIYELAKHSKVSVVQIEYYTQKGIVPYEQLGVGEPRLYNKERVSGRLKEIRRLENEGTTMKELQQMYKKDVENHKMTENLWEA